MKLAPIGLSTYSRLSHLKQTINALQKNTLAKETDLYVFSDAAKPGDELKVDAVRKYLDTINGFKNVHVLKRTQNSRVRNGRDGMYELLNKYGKCIYMEEDIVTAPGFLRFMNESLDFYEKDEKIFSVSGYAPPINIPADYSLDIFILRRACAWGMGIWYDSFKKIHYLDYAEVLERFSSNKEVQELSKYGEDLLRMILLDAEGKIDAFDVKIFYYQFLNDKYTIYPRKSLVRNIGHDGSGVHCGRTNKFDVDLWDKLEFEVNRDTKLDDRIVKSNYSFRQIGKVQRTIENSNSSLLPHISGTDKFGKNLIFLISQPRAGSTLLQRILSGHSDIHTTAEPWIMLHPLYAFKEKGLLAEFDSNLAKQGLEDFISQVPEGQELYFKALRHMGGILYNRALEVSGKRFFLDKTPRYHFIISELKNVFPEAKFIFLLRNPLAVLSSTLKTWFQNNPEDLQKSLNHLDIIQGPLNIIRGIQLFAKEAIVVKYEELVEDAENTIKAICYKLGISYQNGMLIYGSKPKPDGRFGDAIGIVKHDNAVPYYIDNWVKNLQSPQLYEFSLKYMETLSPDVFNLMGYPYQENKAKLENLTNQSDHSATHSNKTSNQHTQSSSNHQSVENLIKILEANIEQNPYSGESHNDLGVLYYQSGQKEKVLYHYQEAVRLNPKNITFAKNLADFSYVEMRNVADAMQLYNRVLEIQPKDTETLLTLGIICADLQKYEDAKYFYSQVLKIEPFNQEARRRLDNLSHDRSEKEHSVHL